MAALSMKSLISVACGVLAFSGLSGISRADLIVDRLDSIERRLTRIESLVQLPPATEPTTQPEGPRPVRVDSFPALRAAIVDGATWIQTTGIEMNADLDARGATIELLPGGPGWKPAIALSGDAVLQNAVLKTPPSTYNPAGQRTGFFKALTATGRNMTIRNVTFAPETGFCIHLLKGSLTLESVRATTFSEYFVFQEAGTYASARLCEVRGGSKAESVWRVAGGNYLIEDCVLDNSAGGKAVLRGDSPGKDGQPGGVARRTRFVGQVGPNPLTEDDGGQMLGIDRWRFAEGWIYQLDYKRKAETLQFARRMYLNGATPEEIVRATADKFIDGAQLAKVAKGKTKLTEGDIKLTLDLRAAEVGRHSRVLIEECEIVGDPVGKTSPLRLNARTSGTIRRTKIQSAATLSPISGNSQQTYPFPEDRVIVGGEQRSAPDITFDAVAIEGGPSLGIDRAQWRSLQFINGSSYNGAPLVSSESPRIFNSTPVAIDGVPVCRTDGGLTYRNAIGQTISAWEGGYDGPGGTPETPAPWTTRWREFNESRLRAFARSLSDPVFVLDIEHWEVDPTVHGEETARKWLEKIATICRIIKQERPDLIVGCYDLLPATSYWAPANWGAWQRWKESGVKDNDLGDDWWAKKEADYRAEMARWQRINDLAASVLLDHVDILCPSIYPQYRLRDEKGKAPSIRGSLVRDADVARLRVEEALRAGKGKPVFPFYWPIVTEDGGEFADSQRTANTVDAALGAGATGVIVWSDKRPRQILEDTLRTAQDVVRRSPAR